MGELNTRTGRMHDFSDNAEIESTLDKMAQWQPDPLVIRLAKVPGTREPRYMHLLAPFSEQASPMPESRAVPAPDDRISMLQAEIERLIGNSGNCVPNSQLFAGNSIDFYPRTAGGSSFRTKRK